MSGILNSLALGLLMDLHGPVGPAATGLSIACPGIRPRIC